MDEGTLSKGALKAVAIKPPIVPEIKVCARSTGREEGVGSHDLIYHIRPK